MAEPFHAFIQNLTVATTATARCSASSASPGPSRPSTPTSLERRPTPAPWTRTPGGACATDSLCARVVTALKSHALLNDSVGAGYVERNWPPALAASGAWPLASLRQSFLNGSLIRLLDPDATFRAKIAEFVGRGDFGLASGRQPDGGYGRTWFGEPVPAEEIAFDSGVFLFRKDRAAAPDIIR